MWTNKDAEDFRIARCPQTKLGDWVDFVPAKNGVLVGGLTFLKNWIIRGEVSDALQKIFIRNVKTNKEEQLLFDDEKVITSGISLMQKYKDLSLIHI